MSKGEKTPTTLSISTTHRPATDLGYLLHKHPDRVQDFPLAFGKAQVHYPQASEEQCRAVLVLDVDPVRLTPGNRDAPSHLLHDYVNDRPYVAASHLAVALNQVYRTAKSGRCEARPELVNTPIPLRAELRSLPARRGEDIPRRILEPLGYQVEMETLPLDPDFPQLGDAGIHNLKVESDSHTLPELLRHLYVLLPVLDNHKHYWIGKAELENLERHGEGWLDQHPERELISKRYLGFRDSLTTEFLARHPGDEETMEDETGGEKKESLHQLRIQAIIERLQRAGAHSVLDLGCGEGRLIEALLKEDSFQKITSQDVSQGTLSRARKRVGREESRVNLLHGSLLFPDPRLEGHAAAVLMEVVEHVGQGKLELVEMAVFGQAQPRTIIVTTPNREWNAVIPDMETKFRHRDHRFEWDRREFREWAHAVADKHRYAAEILPVGEEDPEHGPPTQRVVFTRKQPG